MLNIAVDDRDNNAFTSLVYVAVAVAVAGCALIIGTIRVYLHLATRAPAATVSTNVLGLYGAELRLVHAVVPASVVATGGTPNPVIELPTGLCRRTRGGQRGGRLGRQYARDPFGVVSERCQRRFGRISWERGKKEVLI